MSRIDYRKASPDGIKALGQLSLYTKSSSIESSLRFLVEMRISQINGCLYCLDLHANEAREIGEKQQRLDCLSAWDEAEDMFNDRERTALAWAEAVTLVSQTHVPDAIYNATAAVFTETELADLTLIIVNMNAWNRLAISFRKPVPKRG